MSPGNSGPARLRTALAAVLVLVAIAVPLAAWYAVGTRDVTRQQRELATETRRAAESTAAELATKLQARLEALRDVETRRPFYHYQNLYHDPKGASEGASVVPSPLAEGPGDPFVLAYFQATPAGQLSLPTLNEEVPEVTTNTVAQRAIQQELQSGLFACSPCVELLEQPAPSQLPQQQALSNDAYVQNRWATKVYTDVKGGKAAPRAAQAGVVRVGVDEFHWQSLSLTGGVALATLRLVATPDGKLAQGFVIASAAVAEALRGAPFPARFVPRAVAGPISSPVGETGWSVVVDAQEAFAELPARHRALRAAFVRQFGAGAAAAALAGVCVVGLVWQAERLARQRSQFAAAAAHELRTPLAGLRMYSEMLAEGLGDPTRASEYARRLASESERLGRVVANVLGFTRLERGTLAVQPQPGDFAAAVRECVARQQTALEVAGARVAVTIAEPLPPVRFDRDAVAQIVQNLLDNAEKHTRAATDRTIQVAVTAVDATVLLSVTDHGPGIPGDVRRRLFRPFERGNHADAPAGLGLGLVLVQALAQAHGGRVEYVDADGGGARFIVRLPA